MKILILATDAFGGQGGIAKFNRDLCRALCAEPLAADVTVLPRLPPVQAGVEMPHDLDRRGGTLDDGGGTLEYQDDAAGSKVTYVMNVVRSACEARPGTYDAVICGHINLLPLALMAAWVQRTPLLLILHGVEAWSPHPSPLVRWALRSVDAFVAVSRHTEERFLEWAPLSGERGYAVANCIDLERWSPGPKRRDLLQRYGLGDRTVLLTLGRMSSEERYKGHEQILEILPTLRARRPDIAYLICGDGDDRSRLEAKAARSGLSDHVVFSGYVPEREKADHYRLADAFVMPGRGEGFGIVHLEALACGIPVVASSADASGEVMRKGGFGTVVDPREPEQIVDGIEAALEADRGVVPDGLTYFSEASFRERWHDLMSDVVRS